MVVACQPHRHPIASPGTVRSYLSASLPGCVKDPWRGLIYRTLIDAYDDRPETDKEIWDLRKLGISLNLSQSTHQLNFTVITQPWLRSLAKRYLKYNLAIRSAGDCVSKLTAIRQFSQFLASEAPHAQASDLDRALMLQYEKYKCKYIILFCPYNHIK